MMTGVRLSRLRSRPTGTRCPPVQRVPPVAVFGLRLLEVPPLCASVRDGATPQDSSAAPATLAVPAQESTVARARQGPPAAVRRRLCRQSWPTAPPPRQSAPRRSSLNSEHGGNWVSVIPPSGMCPPDKRSLRRRVPRLSVRLVLHWHDLPDLLLVHGVHEFLDLLRPQRSAHQRGGIQPKRGSGRR